MHSQVKLRPSIPDNVVQRQRNPHGLLVVIEAEGRHRLVQGALTGVAERRVAKVMGQRQSLGQPFKPSERAIERAI